jgi:maleamate amidohydrolase
MAIWDDVMTAEDIELSEKGKYGGKVGFGEKPAIIVIDMIYRFLDPSYASGTCAKMGWPAVHAVKRLLEVARPAGTPVFYTRSLIGRTQMERGHWKHIAWLGSRILTEQEYEEIYEPRQEQIVEEIKPQPGDVVITKPFISAFFSTNLASLLTYNKVDTLIVTGVVTSGCVRATVVDGFQHNYRVIVPEECVGDRSSVSHKVSLFDTQMKYGDVVPLQEVTDYFHKSQRA